MKQCAQSAGTHVESDAWGAGATPGPRWNRYTLLQMSVEFNNPANQKTPGLNKHLLELAGVHLPPVQCRGEGEERGNLQGVYGFVCDVGCWEEVV